jgi:ATP synthase F1 delta subunit
LNKNQIAKKYSRAIVNSVSISEVPAVVSELKAFAALVDGNRQLKRLFAGQIFSEDEKARAFTALVPELKFSASSEKFLKLIIVNGHLSAIREIIASSIDIYNERQKKATAVVVSSVAIDEKYTARLKNALKKMTDRDITIENEIDESLLGGFIVRVGSTIFDSSVKGQLRLLKSELMK